MSTQRQTADVMILDGMMRFCMLALFLYPLWAFLDYQRVEVADLPDRRFMLCLVVRLGVFAVLGIFLAATSLRRIRWERMKAQGQEDEVSLVDLILAGGAIQLLIGVGIISIIFFLEAFDTTFFAGLILVFLGVAILTPWESKWTVLQIGLLILTYISAAFYFYKGPLPTEVYTTFLFLAGAGVLCAYGSKRLHYYVELILKSNIDPFTKTSNERRLSWALVARGTRFVFAVLLLPILAVAALLLAGSGAKKVGAQGTANGEVGVASGQESAPGTEPIENEEEELAGE